MRQSKEIITLVFTDIRGSTELWERIGQHFRYVLEAHNYIIRKSTSKFNGREIKTEGDAFMLAFDHADDAVRFCVEAQEDLNKADWPGITGEILVRMGIHTGQPIFVTDRHGKIDYLGPMVNRASRISEAANGGQILISNSTFEHAALVLKELSVKNLGEHRLRGMEKPEIIRQILPKSLSKRKFFTIRTLDIKKTNLTNHPKTFFGRERDIYQLHKFFNVDKAKVVTITGSGGIGKTRLSQCWGATSLGDYAAGVWFVDLSDATNLHDICMNVSHVLNTPLTETDPVIHLAYAIKSMCQNVNGPVLLVLDNCEQVAEEVGKVLIEWIAIAHKACFLVTSRVLLNISNEKEHILKHLSVPNLNKIDSVDLLRKFNSIKLFAGRSYEANSEFELNDENILTIAEICIRLDGLPLAIELAASRSRILKPSKILERLDNRFELLQSNQQDYSKRQRTLKETIDWSWSLLSDCERSVLAQLSVFNHIFHVGHAENVVSLNGFDNNSVINVLQTLREKSILNLIEPDLDDEEMAFSMYYSIRAYASEKLVELDIKKSTAERWKKWTLQHAKESWIDFIKTHSSESYHKLDHISKDLITLSTDENTTVEESAWAAAYILPILDKRGPDLTSKELINHNLKRFGISYEYNNGQVELNNIVDHEVVHRLINHLAISYKKSSPKYALTLNEAVPENSICYFDALVESATSYMILGQPLKASDNIEKALAIPHLELQQKCYAQLQLGQIFYSKGDYPKALTCFEYVIENSVLCNNKMLELKALGNLGLIQLDFGHQEKALEHFNQSLTLSKKHHDEVHESVSLGQIGLVKNENNEKENALNYFKKAINLARKLGEQRQEMNWLINIGNVYSSIDDFLLAREIYDQALAIAQRLGDRSNIALANGKIGVTLNKQGDHKSALEHLYDSLETTKLLGEQSNSSYWLGCIGQAIFDRAFSKKLVGDFKTELHLAQEYLSSSLELIEKLKLQRNIAIEIIFAKAEWELGNTSNAKKIATEALLYAENFSEQKRKEYIQHLEIAQNIVKNDHQLTD